MGKQDQENQTRKLIQIYWSNGRRALYQVPAPFWQVAIVILTLEIEHVQTICAMHIESILVSS